jgi:hypothetical protein
MQEHDITQLAIDATARMVTGSQQMDAGQRLIHFLGSKAAEAAIRRSGMDPVKLR